MGIVLLASSWVWAQTTRPIDSSSFAQAETNITHTTSTSLFYNRQSFRIAPGLVLQLNSEKLWWNGAQQQQPFSNDYPTRRLQLLMEVELDENWSIYGGGSINTPSEKSLMITEPNGGVGIDVGLRRNAGEVFNLDIGLRLGGMGGGNKIP